MIEQYLITRQKLLNHLHDDHYRIIDCRFALTAPNDGHKAYLSHHIPGSHYAHLDNDLSSAITTNSGRHPLPAPDVLAKRFSDWGIDADKQVVVYDDSSGGIACRLWWLLRWLGHNAVAVLDGGYPAWQQQNYPVSTTLPESKPNEFAARQQHNSYVSSHELQKMLGDHRYRLVDARTPERFRGDCEPIDRKAGHIPGAINIPWLSNLDKSGYFLPMEQLKLLYSRSLGDTAPHNTIVMCGSGVTACQTIMAMSYAGFTDTRLYAGSWSEWITSPNRPIAQQT